MLVMVNSKRRGDNLKTLLKQMLKCKTKTTFCRKYQTDARFKAVPMFLKHSVFAVSCTEVSSSTMQVISCLVAMHVKSHSFIVLDETKFFKL